ncbi:MAG: phytoene desaturase family protein [Sporichthyaceae bacterium]
MSAQPELRAEGLGTGADVLVIGAGHNGLVAACYLAQRGVTVTVVEAEAIAGGCTRTAAVIPEAPEHLINLGAVDFLWIRASTVISDLALWRYGYAEAEVDPAFAYLHRDGASVAVWRDPVRTAEELRRFSSRDASAYLDFVLAQDALLDVMMPMLLANPTRPSASVMLSAARAAATRLGRLAPMANLLKASAVDIVTRRFTHPVARDLVAGMGAIAAPITEPGSGLALLFGGMVHRLGMSRPIGGSQALPDALARCLVAHGGVLRTGAVVEEVLVEGGRVRGARLDSGQTLRASIVLASCDPKRTLRQLLPDGVLTPRQAARADGIPTGNMGAAHLKVDLALAGPASLARHTAARSDGLDLRIPSTFVGSLDEIVGALEGRATGKLPDPLPFWAIVPSAIDPSQAPEGQDTLYLWAGWMPPEPTVGWDRAADHLVASAAEYFDGLGALELGREAKGPLELAHQMRLTDGQPWHVDFSRAALGPLRPAVGFGGYRTPVDGLYLTGAGTHPCPGVSGIPGQLAARELLRRLQPKGSR